MNPVLKLAITSVIIVAASEAAKRSSFLGALLVSLPLTSLLAIGWLYYDTGDPARVAQLTRSILWLVLPSLAFFVALPALIEREIAFGWAFALSCGTTIAAYWLMILAARQLGYEL